jgi:L-malate glycosyltransferase
MSTDGTPGVRRLRILYLPSWYPTPEKPQYAIFLKVQAEALARDHDVVVFPVPATLSLLGGPSNWKNRVEVEGNGSAVKTLRVSGPNYHPGWPDAEERTLLRLYRRGLYETIRLWGGPPDLIHAQVAWAGGYYGALLAREIGCPLVLTEQISRPYLLLEKPRDRHWFRFAMREADIVMCLSPAQQEQLRRVGVDREIVVVPDLIDTDLFSPGTPPPGRPIRLITVGSLIERKGVAHLLDAVATLRAGGTDLVLSVVGDGPLRPALEEMARTLGIASQVDFHGDCSLLQVRDLLRQSHVYVSPSLTESLGIAVIEGISVGLPAVVTRSGGPETFMTPDEGVVVEPGDPAELVRGIREVLGQPRRFDVQRLHQSAVERFGIRSVTSRIDTQYRRALAGRTHLAKAGP